MTFIKKKTIFAATFSFLCTALLGINSNVFAVNSSPEQILEKTLVGAIPACFKVMEKEIKNSTGVDTSSGGVKKALFTHDQDIINIPSRLGNTNNSSRVYNIDDGNLDCYQVFAGYNGWGQSVKGLESVFNKKPTSLAQLGYNVSQASGESRTTLTFYYHKSTVKDSYGRLVTNPSSDKIKIGQLIYLNDNFFPEPWVQGDGGEFYGTYDGSNFRLYSTSGDYTSAPLDRDKMLEYYNNRNVEYNCAQNQEFVYECENATITVVRDVTNEDPTNQILTRGSSFSPIVNFFTGRNNSVYNFNDHDRYVLYYAYLNNSRSVVWSSETFSSMPEARRSNTYKYYAYDELTQRFRGIANPDDIGISGENYNLIGRSNKAKTLSSNTDFTKVLEAIQALNYTELGLNVSEEPENILDPDGTGGTTSTESNEGESLCATGGQSLGWIICPVLNALGDAITNLWIDWIEPSLEVKSGFFSLDDGSNGLYKTWQSFRDIANIIFVIALAVIIFSQITGFGVDNYGIKKTLPRLIIMAILVNLSFLVCQLMVDIINISSMSIKEILISMRASLQFDRIEAFGGFLQTFVTGGVVVAGGGVFAGLVIGGTIAPSTIIIPLLVLAVTILLSIVTFVIILGVRQAAVIILVALSPIAIICYSLPNMKRFYDRWQQMFLSMLLLYPISIVLVYGGQLAAGVMMSTPSADKSVILAFTSLIIQIATIFIIPGIARSSFSAMGNIGNKIAGFGDRLRQRAGGGIRESEGLNRWAAERRSIAAQRGQAFLNRENRHGVRRSDTALGRLATRNNARNIAAYSKLRREDQRAQALARNYDQDREDAFEEARIAQDTLNEQITQMELTGQYVDGSSSSPHTFNPKNRADIEKALKASYDRYEATGDQKALNNANALATMLMRTGPKGADALKKAVAPRLDNAIASGSRESQVRNTDIARALSHNKDVMDGLHDRNDALGSMLASIGGAGAGDSGIVSSGTGKTPTYAQSVAKNLPSKPTDFGSLSTEMAKDLAAAASSEVDGEGIDNEKIAQLARLGEQAFNTSSVVQGMSQDHLNMINAFRRKDWSNKHGGSDSGFVELTFGNTLKIDQSSSDSAQPTNS